jgi:PiT family inorganic phosphate transporter
MVRDHHDQASEANAQKATAQLTEIHSLLENRKNASDIPRDDRFKLRQDLLLADKTIGNMIKDGHLGLTADETKKLTDERKAMRGITDYAPTWVLIAIACALGIGTMVGWKRIVVTVGEKIGKSHLTYAQGAAAEIVAASTIGVSAYLGLPVSTTHVLSSGIAGTMVAQRSGLQASTVRNIGLAWLLTLPVSMILSGVFFLVFRALLA